MSDSHKPNSEPWKNRIVGYSDEPPDQLLASPWNWRVHPKNQQDALQGALSEIGMIQNVICNRTTGHVVDGHLRISLALRTEQPFVPVTWVELSEEEERMALLTIDPLSAMAVADTTLLDQLLREVQTADEDLMTMLAELAASTGLYPDKPPVQTPGEQITETEAERLAKEYNIQPGQTWQLGRHLIACVDSLDEQQVKGVIGENKASFVWSDPPYGISIVATNGYVGGGEAYDIPFGGVKKRKGNVGGGETIKASPGLYPIQMKKKGFGSSNGAKPFGNEKLRGSVGASNMIEVGKYALVIGDETTQTAEKSSGLYLKLYPDAIHVWWGANYYANILPPSSCWIVWDKENTGNFADAELAWCSDKSAVRIFKHMWNGLMKESEKGIRRVHPTQKPIALAHWCFEKYGKAGDVIVDPFLGSGISVLAAEQLGDDRRVIGFELAPEYIAVTIHRWEMLTGQKASLATSAQPLRLTQGEPERVG